MPKPQTAALPLAYVFIRIVITLNWILGAGILGLLLATIVAQEWIFRALGITGGTGIPQAIAGLRWVAVLGLVSIPLNFMVLNRLLAIVVTVRRGDPFVAENAYRLNAIAWVLLALQIISLVIGAIGKALSTQEHPLHLDASFSTS